MFNIDVIFGRFGNFLERIINKIFGFEKERRKKEKFEEFQNDILMYYRLLSECVSGKISEEEVKRFRNRILEKYGCEGNIYAELGITCVILSLIILDIKLCLYGIGLKAEDLIRCSSMEEVEKLLRKKIREIEKCGDGNA